MSKVNVDCSLESSSLVLSEVLIVSFLNKTLCIDPFVVDLEKIEIGWSLAVNFMKFETALVSSVVSMRTLVSSVV